jgi:hypothetical protein
VVEAYSYDANCISQKSPLRRFIADDKSLKVVDGKSLRGDRRVEQIANREDPARLQPGQTVVYLALETNLSGISWPDRTRACHHPEPKMRFGVRNRRMGHRL